MRVVRDDLAGVLYIIYSLLVFAALTTANEKATSDSAAPILIHRDLKQFELANIMLLSTLDGSLQARNRDTGLILWTLESSPLVDIRKTDLKSPFASSAIDSQITWLAEPSPYGGLFYFTPEGGIEKIPASVWNLVQKAPFGMVGNVVYTGSWRTTLYALDIKTGKIIQSFGEMHDIYTENFQIDPANVIMIGRTEYTLDIHDQIGHPGWKIHIGLWTPNYRDQDLESQYTSPLDSLYLAPLDNKTIMALAENDMRPQRWMGETSSLLIDVFDVLKSSTDGHLSVVHQPPLKLSGVATEWDLYVSSGPTGAPVVVSGPRYAALLGSAPLADHCSNSGTDILGVHPLWCQGRRRTPDGLPPAISLLPSASPATYPQYPRIDPPLEQEAEVKSKWSFFKRTIENAGIVVVIFAIFALCASQGWLPVDLVAAMQRLMGRAHRAQSNHQNQQKSSQDEPKKRKRGSRGGRRNNNSSVKQKSKEKTVDATGKDVEINKFAATDIESPITISDVVLGYGSHGTTVFKGRYEGRDVAVKRMLLEFYDVASQEVDILRESDDHPNVVRYYCKHETDQFLYIALELCPGTLEDMVRGSNQFSVMYQPLDALRQVTLGLQHLHNLQIVHRDIKPQNILVALPTGRLKNLKVPFQSIGVRYLISDFGLCRRLEGEQSSFMPTFADSVGGTAGWAAPEISSRDPPDKKRLTRAVDIFSMGCLFYYVLTGGKHPFGDPHMRQVNIQELHAPQIEESGLVTPEAMDLIPRMLDVNPQVRPTTDRILKHPIFWSDQMKLDFLVKVSDRLEHDSREEQSELIDRLEIHAANVVGKDWHSHFPQMFIDNLGKYRRYHGDRILDLLRALRNKLHHYNDYSPELKECVGNLPSGYLNFFTTRFPRLLMIVYYYAEAEFKDEEAFSAFF